MKLVKLGCCGLEGIDGYLVTVEVSRGEAAGGCGRTTVVGLPDSAVRESIDRITPALFTAGVNPGLHDHLVVNLAPADRRKEGPAFDLAIALGVALSRPESLSAGDLSPILAYAELALDGRLRPVRGTLSAALCGKRHGLKAIMVAPENAAEAAAVDGPRVLAPRDLRQALEWIQGGLTQAPVWQAPPVSAVPPAADRLDYADVRGQESAKRAIAVAAAGSHNLLMIGPPGSGKTMLARRLPSILPPMTRDECLTVTSVHSSAGLIDGAGLLRERPFRAPHHSISGVGLIGGGTTPRAGEISLAHHGVLFLDELPEFPRQVLETMRQPLEDGSLTIARASGRVTFPARAMLVAAMNPCPCGYLGHPQRRCTDNAATVHRYRAKISGPLLDRIDLHIEVPASRPQDLAQAAEGSSSAQMQAQVIAARERMLARQGCANAHLAGRSLRQHCRLPSEATELLHHAIDELGLSARAHDRILKVARTLADLDGSQQPSLEHVSEAVGYRLVDRQVW